MTSERPVSVIVRAVLAAAFDVLGVLLVVVGGFLVSLEVGLILAGLALVYVARTIDVA